MGCRPGDIVFECMNYNLYAGGLSDHLTFETLGAATIPFGVGHSERLLTMMAGLRDPVGIWATPSYAVRLAEVAGELGIEPRSVGLRRGYSRARPGSRSPAIATGSRRPGAWSRATSTGPASWASIRANARRERRPLRRHRHRDHRADRPRHRRVLPFVDGQQGEAVYTSIRREASPLLRMRSHDLMQVFTEPCPCGRTTFRFRILGRSDDMFIVKGVNVFPLAIQAVLMALAPRAPVSSRSSSTGRHRSTTQCRSRSRSRATCPSAPRATRARGRRSAPAPTLNFTRGRDPRRARRDRDRGQDPPGRPPLSRGGQHDDGRRGRGQGDIAIVTLARPEKLNAINDEMLDELLEAVEAIGRDEAIGAAILTGRGRAFSAGGDIAAMDGMDETHFAATIARYMRVSAAFRACPRPIVAAIHGYVLAGGFELALMCDIRFATRGTRFGLPDTPLGLSPTSGMTWLLPRIVGLGACNVPDALRQKKSTPRRLRPIGLVDRVTQADTVLGRGQRLRAAHRLVPSDRRRVRPRSGFLRALESDFDAATNSEAAAELACFTTDTASGCAPSCGCSG